MAYEKAVWFSRNAKKGIGSFQESIRKYESIYMLFKYIAHTDSFGVRAFWSIILSRSKMIPSQKHAGTSASIFAGHEGKLKIQASKV